jgi:hypothetical protein
MLDLLGFKPQRPLHACDFIQTDNGLEFQSSFHRYVTGTLGWDHHYIHKSTLNEDAVIERSFRSDDKSSCGAWMWR